MQKKMITSLILIVLSVLLICLSSVFAWIAFRHDEPLGTAEAAEMMFDTSLTIDGASETISHNSDFTTSFSCDNLAYLDLYYDVTNPNNVFNKMVSIATITITNKGYVPFNINLSLDVKLVVSGSEYDTKGLIYLFVPSTYTNDQEEVVEFTDYATYINGLLTADVSSDEAVRTAIDNSNSMFFDDCTLTNINDVYSFKLVLIGDYNNLDDTNYQEKTNYLTNVFKINLTFDIEQVH